MKQKLLYIIMLIVTLAWSSEAWGVDHLPISNKSVSIASKGGFNWDDKTSVLQFNGIPYKISFSYSRSSGAATGVNWYIDVSSDGSSYTRLWNSDNNSGSESNIEITNHAVRYIKFCYSGNFGGNFTNISITEHPLAYTIDKEAIAFGTKTKGGGESSQKVKLTHINAKSSTTVSCSDATNFGVSPTAISSGKDKWGEPEITVTYKNTKVGSHSATVTISDGTNTKTVSVSGATQTTYYGKAVATKTAGGNAYVTFTETNASTATTTEATTNTTTTNPSASSTAYFRADPDIGYGFKGWIKGTGDYSEADKESGNLSFSVPINYSSENQNSPTPTTYKACFGPEFKFSAAASSKNPNYGTASVKFETGFASPSISKTVVGDIGEENDSKKEYVFFTAEEKTGCIFLGWFSNQDCSGNPESTDKSYSVELTSTISASGSKTLYALFKKKQELQWKSGLDFNLVLNATVESPAIIKANSSKTITYSVDTGNDGAITIDADGKTIRATRLGTSIVTASVEGDTDWNAETISEEFTVDEIKQATFRPSWTDDPTSIEKGHSKTIELLNIATDGTFTIYAIPTGIISWSRNGNILTITGDALGEAKLTLTQAGNTFLNGNTAEYNIKVTKHPNNFALAAKTKEIEVEKSWSNVVTDWGLGKERTTVTSSNSNVADYDKGSNTITAKAAGETTITFKQNSTDDDEGVEMTVTVTVTRKANTLSLSLPELTVDVDETITPSIAEGSQNNTTTPLKANITNEHQTTSVNKGTSVIAFENGVIVAKNAGTATVTLYQPADADGKYAASRNFTFDITVNKINNALTVTLDGEQRTSRNSGHNETISIGYSSDYQSDGDFQITRNSGSDASAIISDDGKSIITKTEDDTNVWTISQAETYKYEAASATIRIKVNSVVEQPSYLHTSLTGGDNYSWNTGVGNDYEVSVDYIPTEIRFNAWHTTTGVNESITVTYKDANGNVLGSKKHDITSESKTYWVENLPENTRKFSFSATGSWWQYISDVYVVRKTYIEATADITNFGYVYTNETATATIKVDWGSSNGGDIKIESSDPVHFSANPTTITGTANSNGSRTITITYTPNPAKVNQEDVATITVSDRYYTQDIVIKGTALKQVPSIARGSNTDTSVAVERVLDNVFAFDHTSAAYPSAYTAQNTPEFYYSITQEQTSDVNMGDDVIRYDPENNTITGLNQGTARLTITQNETDLVNAATASFDFTVSKVANKVTIALSATTLNVDGTSKVQLTNDDSKGDITVEVLDISYSYPDQNRDGGLLSYTAATKEISGVNAGTGTVKVTQVETYKYTEKSQQFTVTVNKLEQNFHWDNPDLETSLQIGTTVTDNTASSDEEGLTDVTYKSSNTAVISVNSNTGVFTADATGSSTITASQAGNYKYLPATITRKFSVFNKQTPAYVADSHFSGSTGRIELTCTATITVTGVSTGEDFTVTYGNKEGEAPEPVISVTQSGETITITALRIGNATLTLKQEGNDDFIAKTQTYNIEVFWPDYFLSLASTTAPTHAAGNYKKIFFTRTLKKGYSTIALPFTTTVAALTGRAANADDWIAQLSAVTKSAADGYTLYFQKVEGGTITANQPYILHLGSAVENPTWTDMTDGITVVAATAGENTAQTGYSEYSDWVMKANYSPNCDMEGKYGVVNGEGVLKKGSTGSTLKAFHAYITGPAAAGVKAAYLDEDEADGILELINNLENQSGDQLIYDLQGRRLPRAQAGINIVIRDGKVRKEIEPRR